jgi:hypothetical protein
MPGTTMEARIGDEGGVPAPGDRVRLILKAKGFGEWIEARRQHRRGRLNVGDVLVLETRWAQQYDQDGNPKGPKIEDQAAADAVPRNVTIGFYGLLSIREGTDARLDRGRRAGLQAPMKPLPASSRRSRWRMGRTTATSSPMSHHKVRCPERRCRSDGPPPTPRPHAAASGPAAAAGLLPHAPAHHHHRAAGRACGSCSGCCGWCWPCSSARSCWSWRARCRHHWPRPRGPFTPAVFASRHGAPVPSPSQP